MAEKTLIFFFITCVVVQVKSDLQVDTPLGKVQGVQVQSTNGQNVNAFLGVPYAEPPIGALRFLPPQKKQPWQSVFVADKLPNTCKQHPFKFLDNPVFASWAPKTKTSEDCLYLNIWVPDPKPTKAAVMVWIHGGGFNRGSISVEKYDGAVMAAEENIIVVTINYRLSIFGFLKLEGTEAKGNMGLLDQVEALQWIQDNIESYGGDKDKVTIFGESAGGMSVELHLLSKKSQNLFSSGIIQSGPLATIKPTEKRFQQKAVQNMITHFNCSTDGTSDVLECLRAVDEDDMISSLPKEALLLFGTEIDGEFLTNDYEILIQQKQFHDVPVILGTTSEDGSVLASLMYSDVFPSLTEDFYPKTIDFEHLAEQMFSHYDNLIHEAVVFFYTDWKHPNDPIRTREEMVKMVTDFYMICPTNDLARHLAEAGITVYQYQYSHVPSNSPFPKWMGSTHGDEIEFIFGRPLRPNQEYKKQEIKLSKKIMHYWANFAKYGNPNGKSDAHPDLYPWPAFTLYHKKYIDLSTNITSGEGLRTEKCAFWDGAFPAMQVRIKNFEKRAEMCI